MTPPLKQWDTEIAPHLHNIERHCQWIRYYTTELVKCIELLKERPAFETKAQTDLEAAELMVQGARREFLSKPVEKK